MNLCINNFGCKKSTIPTNHECHLLFKNIPDFKIGKFDWNPIFFVFTYNNFLLIYEYTYLEETIIVGYPSNFKN